jgi:hypothetical protein
VIDDKDGPSQKQVRALHARRYSTPAIAKDLGITADRVRKICATLRLIPWPSKRTTEAKARESRQDIERRVAIRRAAVGKYWRQHPTASAAEVAEALGISSVSDVRSDRITLGLSIRRGPDSIRKLAAEGLSAAEISRRCGVGAELVRRIMAERQASTD